jgi:MerR family transcriptional regulator, redox-sensitive transcriptional activator SoxR
MTIGELARLAGLKASAIRYYEQAGLLPRAPRQSGRRVYGEPMLTRLEVIDYAKQSGFTLEEIRRLLHGAPVSARWQALVAAKLADLDAQADRIVRMRTMLERISKCRCVDVEECGRILMEHRSQWPEPASR